jgi:two-component system sensor histidine kinase/response regulator
VNREIAAELLEMIGIEHDNASDGAEALEQLFSHPPAYYDLILMDIQMPRLDGLSAVREIRRSTGYEQLPVIAMTAHVLAHEREESQRAGMSDHLGKPVRPEDFYRVVARWIKAEKRGRRPGPAADPLPAAPIPESVAPDPTSLAETPAELEALARFGGKPERYARWLREYHETVADRLTEIAKQIAQGERKAAAELVHALKGRTGNLGLDAMHAACSALESALKSGADTDLLWNTLVATEATTRTALDAKLAHRPAAS